MSIVKNKFSATALVVATVMGLGYSAVASADSTTFTTTINVISDNKCQLDVVQPANPTFAATWTKTAGVDDATMTVDSTASPVFIGVNMHTGSPATCNLNDVKIGTDVTGTVEAAAATGPASAAWLEDFGSAGGKWRFAPSLAQLKLYTSNGYEQADIVPATNIAVKDALGVTHNQQVTAKVTGGDSVRGAALPAMGNQEDSYTLTDGFFNTAAGFVPMAAKSGADLTYSLSGASAGAKIQSLEVGVGGILGADPEDGAGNIDRMAAADGDTATLTWVTTVSLS